MELRARIVQHRRGRPACLERPAFCPARRLAAWPALAWLAWLVLAWPAAAAPVSIVAAESTYGAIAQAVGGRFVAVRSIIDNPDVDPHDFEAQPSTARAVAGATIVIANGLGYDGWMTRLVAAGPERGRHLVVASEVGRAWVLADHNPHVFYDTRVAAAVAERVATLLRQADPAHAADYARNLAALRASLAEVDARVAQLRRRYPGLRVTATEPVYGYMLRALGWSSSGQALQFDVMNDTEPPPAVVARYEDALRGRRVALLIYNRQVHDPLTRHLEALARSAGVPTVGVDEFTPPHTGYAAWLLHGLSDVARALPAPR